MWVYLVSAIFLLFVICYEPYHQTVKHFRSDNGYFVSLVTIKNSANAPFYYHTSLELIKRSNSSLGVPQEERFSYGFYPDYSELYNVSKLIKPVYRFLRPIYSMPGRIRTPDILYEGSEEYNIKPGKVVYRETYPVIEKEWLNLKYRISHMSIANDLPFINLSSGKPSYEMPLFYSYPGSYLSDNCSSWVRKMLNKYIKVDISCQSYRFDLLGLHFAVPLSPFDFPFFCSSSASTEKSVSVSHTATGYTNFTRLR